MSMPDADIENRRPDPIALTGNCTEIPQRAERTGYESVLLARLVGRGSSDGTRDGWLRFPQVRAVRVGVKVQLMLQLMRNRKEKLMMGRIIVTSGDL
jgi:hypothetical protein